MRRRNKSPVIAGLLIVGFIFFGCCCGPFSLLTRGFRPEAQIPREHLAASLPAESVQPETITQRPTSQQRPVPKMPTRQQPVEEGPPTASVTTPPVTRLDPPDSSSSAKLQIPAVPEIEEPALGVREWTSGQFKTNAEFVSLKDGVVTLRKQTGGTADVPLNRLAVADRHYIKNLIRVDRSANVIVGKVTAVIDGDTFTLADEDGNQHRVRLNGIDAPEVGQVFGDKAKAALESLLLGKTPWIEWSNSDSEGFVKGKVFLEGEFINLRMLGDGLGWHVRVDDPSSRFENAERIAKVHRHGLWINTDPAAPWTYREANRRAGK